MRRSKMKNILLTVLLVVFSFNVYAKNAFDYYNDGVDKYDAKDYNGALACFVKAIKIKPEFAKPYNKAGLAYAAMNNFDQAILMYKEAVIADPNYAEAYYNMGVGYELEQKLPLAVKNYTKAIDLNNDTHVFVRASLNLAMLDREEAGKTKNRSKDDEAIALLRKASIYEPDFAELYNEAGLIYLDTELYDNAVQQFQTALEKDQHYSEASVNLSIAYERKGNLARAANQSQEALKINENFPGAQYNYGNMCILDGYYDDAIAHLQRAIELYSNIHILAGNFNDNIMYAKTPIKFDPNAAAAFYSLGKAYMHKNMFKEAEDSYKKALKINKTFTLAKRALGQMAKLKKDLKSHIKAKPTPVQGQEGETTAKEGEDKTNESGETAKADESSKNDSGDAQKAEGDQNQAQQDNGEEGQAKPKEEGWE
jgi:tetratricopeptide (TPR) repeat protein